MKELFLSVDLGGTSLRIGVLDSTGKILTQLTLNSDRVRKPQELVQCLTEEFLKFYQDTNLPGSAIVGAGLGIPGLVHQQEGKIFQSPHFPLWKNFALKNELQSRLPFPIFLENDANKAALGEAYFGAGKDLEDFVMLTLGTGIGAGIIFRRQVFHGSQGFAGEVGHIVIEREGLPGALGIQGTLETFASMSGLRLHLTEIQNAYAGDPEKDPICNLKVEDPKFPEKLAGMAKEGNVLAIGLWKQFGKALACGIASLANTLGIFNYVIGGGLTGSWDLFYPACQRELPKRIYPSTFQLIQIQRAQLGNEAGLVGAIPLIRQGMKN